MITCMERKTDAASESALLQVRSYTLKNTAGRVLEPIIAEYFSSDETVFTWPCSLALSVYLLCNPQLIEGKIVLELGSGTGLVSIVSLMLGAQHVISTERCVNEFPMGYFLLRYNYKLNLCHPDQYTVVSKLISQPSVTCSWLVG